MLELVTVATVLDDERLGVKIVSNFAIAGYLRNLLK